MASMASGPETAVLNVRTESGELGSSHTLQDPLNFLDCLPTKPRTITSTALDSTRSIGAWMSTLPWDPLNGTMIGKNNSWSQIPEQMDLRPSLNFDPYSCFVDIRPLFSDLTGHGTTLMDFELDCITRRSLSETLPTSYGSYSSQPVMSNDGLDRQLSMRDCSSTLTTTSQTSVVCQICAVEFTGKYSRGNLARHMRHIHDGRIVLLECADETCDKRFKRQDARLKHIRKYHPHLASAALPRKRGHGTSHKEQDYEFENIGSPF